MDWPLHGSNPQYVYEHLQLTMPKQVTDFSVNLNPFGPPAVVREKWAGWFNEIEDYPDPTGKELVEIIAGQEQVTVSSVLLGNGGAEIIALLASMFAGKRVLLIQPTFSEYERMCKANGCQISYLTVPENDWEIQLPALEEQLTHADVLFLCHPNNPTGVTYSNDLLLNIMEACQRSECQLVIDEAFYDFLEKPNSGLSIKDNPDLIVIRSLTKMYAMAGLRLGYVLAAPEMIEKLHRLQPHWSVNALALLAGKECLLAEDYAERTRDFIAGERKRIIPALREAGYLVSDSKVNFYLLRDPDLAEQLPLFTFLLEKRIVARHTANYHGLNGRWLRFAIKQAEANNILLEALVAWKHRI